MKPQIKLLAQKFHSSILEYFLKHKYTKYFVSEMEIITTLFTQEIIRQNKCQTRFLDKLVLKEDVDKN